MSLVKYGVQFCFSFYCGYFLLCVFGSFASLFVFLAHFHLPGHHVVSAVDLVSQQHQHHIAVIHHHNIHCHLPHHHLHHHNHHHHHHHHHHNLQFMISSNCPTGHLSTTSLPALTYRSNGPAIFTLERHNFNSN